MSTTLKINLPLLQSIHHHAMIHGVPYVWGMKPCAQVPFPADTNQLKGSDCSGYTQYLMRRLGVDWPEGSAEQWEHVKASGYEKVDYSGVQHSLGRLYVAFIEEVPRQHAGHVWFVSGGWTLECYGGVGVGQRKWDVPVLKREVAACYRLV